MKLLTIREGASRLGCSQALVYQLSAGRRMTQFRFETGRGTGRIAEEELEKLLAGCDIECHRLAENLKRIRLR